jgi:predicted nucleic acid-binding protein
LITGVASHPDDDAILSAAVGASADCIVTGDRQFLLLGQIEGIPIRTPAEFLFSLISMLDQ